MKLLVLLSASNFMFSCPMSSKENSILGKVFFFGYLLSTSPKFPTPSHISSSGRKEMIALWGQMCICGVRHIMAFLLWWGKGNHTSLCLFIFRMSSYHQLSKRYCQEIGTEYVFLSQTETCCFSRGLNWIWRQRK